MRHPRPPLGASAPELEFQVEGAAPLRHAAAPSLHFDLHIEAAGGEPIRSIMLRVQLQIAARQRHYNDSEQARLAELFGPPSHWSTSLRTIPWLQSILLVPPFVGSTTVSLPVACTYDFEVLSTKYFHNLEEGEIPLEFLFSGTVFYAGEQGLQVVQISWEKEASYRLPLAVWQEMMAHYFPNSSWLRLRQDLFDRLYAYRVRHGLPSWEAALEALLPEPEIERRE